MSRIKKGTPGKGGNVRADSFSYTPVPHGLKNAFNAWMAGEPYWCQAHEHTEAQRGTKPCLGWLTDGVMRCARCRPHVVPTWIGYVPLYREIDHKPIMVLVHESGMDLLQGLHYPMAVLVGRVDEKSSVFVRKSDNGVFMRTDNEHRKRAVDITCNLLSMWNLPEFERWLMEERRAESMRGQEAAASKESTDTPTEPTQEEVDDAFLVSRSWGGALTDEQKEKIRQRRNQQFAADAKKPKKNGKH